MNNNTEKTIRVAIYARVANGEQIDIDRKIRVCSEYIEHIPNHTIVAKYTDLNKSGRNISDRSGFQQMLFDAKNGMFDLIVVCELNDFSRNVSDVIYRMHDLKGMGITVYFISDNIRTDNPDDEFRMLMMASLQQEESHRQSQRVKFGQMKSRANGTIFGTGNVLGYDKVDGNYVIDPTQAETVRMIFKHCIDGVGIRKICSTLEAQGKLTSTGKSVWRPTTVSRILKNPVYCGKIRYSRSDEIIDGSHEPIVSIEDFDKVQQILMERGKKYGE